MKEKPIPVQQFVFFFFLAASSLNIYGFYLLKTAHLQNLKQLRMWIAWK